MFFRLFVFVFSTFGTFFLQLRTYFSNSIILVTVKRKVILTYHKKNCVAGARRDFLVLAFPLHVKGFLGHQKCEVF